jgi:hypothetical protein
VLSLTSTLSTPRGKGGELTLPPLVRNLSMISLYICLKLSIQQAKGKLRAPCSYADKHWPDCTVISERWANISLIDPLPCLIFAGRRESIPIEPLPGVGYTPHASAPSPYKGEETFSAYRRPSARHVSAGAARSVANRFLSNPCARYP